MHTLSIRTKTRVITHNVSNSNISVSVNGRRIFVNGKQVDTITKEDGDEITVNWDGDLANLDATHVTVAGDVKGKVDATHVRIGGNVGGNVDSTHVDCGDIQGNVDATHVKAKVIHGKVDANIVNGSISL